MITDKSTDKITDTAIDVSVQTKGKAVHDFMTPKKQIVQPKEQEKETTPIVTEEQPPDKNISVASSDNKNREQTRKKKFTSISYEEIFLSRNRTIAQQAKSLIFSWEAKPCIGNRISKNCWMKNIAKHGSNTVRPTTNCLLFFLFPIDKHPAYRRRINKADTFEGNTLARRERGRFRSKPEGQGVAVLCPPVEFCVRLKKKRFLILSKLI